MIYTHFNPEFVAPQAQTFVQQLLACKTFENSDRLLGYSKGRGTTWFLNTHAELGVNTVLRHYYRGGLFGKVIKDQYLFTQLDRTRTAQEFAILQQMHAWGLPVPRPVAYQVKRSCFWYQADILIELIPHTQDLSKLLQQTTLSVVQYQQIGRIIRALHDHQVCHTDLNIHNILLDNQGQFWLIDFDKCRIQSGNEWKQENLARLLRSFKKEQTRLNIQFSEADWAALCEGYQSTK